MKHIPSLWFALCVIATLSSLAFYQYYFKQDHYDPGYDKIIFCKNANKTSSNYHGPSLISSSSDSKDLILCQGDTFGDLNDTYIKVKSCYLAMYYKDKMIWSSQVEKRGKGKIQNHDDDDTCAFSLQRDGNLVLYQEGFIYANPGGKMVTIWTRWDSQTNLLPIKTELRLQNQQVQILQIFKDGSERSFYADANYQDFREDLGEPIKVADKFIIKNRTDENRVFLKRNEYMGDLNGIHLILQTDCQLQLLNKNITIWSFTSIYRHEMDCFLGLREMNLVGIYKKDNTAKNGFRLKGQGIMNFHGFLPIIQTKITFEDDQPIIIQTLKNGSELIFYSEPGHNPLRLKREPRQIAEKTLNVQRDVLKEYKMERMNYIGNLTGLHLILEQNCSLLLLTADQKLWELQTDSHDGLPMDCSLEFSRSGSIILKREWQNFYGGDCSLLERDHSLHMTGYQLTLENNGMIITRQYANRASDLYHADSRTRGVLFQAIAENSVVLNHDDEKDRSLPKMGYIGDLNGVYVLFEENCNWVLYNKTQIVWESGSSLDNPLNRCQFILFRNGTMTIYSREFDENYQEKPPLWSSPSLEKGAMETELIVNNDGLYLINTFNDGSLLKYKAKEGSHNFVLQKEKEQLIIN